MTEAEFFQSVASSLNDIEMWMVIFVISFWIKDFK